MSGDGRLDLDELGEVIDHASTLEDPARTEVIDDGNGRSWAERLEDTGVTPWLRRHRVALASVAAVAVVAAAGVVAVRALVPPPIDPDMRVTVTSVVPAQYVIGGSMQSYDQVGIFGTGAVLRSAYALTRQNRDDTSRYTITGITGPGVRASSASRQPPPRGEIGVEVARQDVDVLVDCFDVEAPLPAGSYSLLVTRTDDRGRTLTRAVPLDDPVVNWPAYVTASCLGLQSLFGLTPESVELRDGPGHGVVHADVTVANRLEHPAILSVGPVYGQSAVVASMTPTTLAARTGGVLPLTFAVQDCANPLLSYVGMPVFPGDDSYDGGGDGVYLDAWFPAVELDPAFDPSGLGGRMQAPLRFTPAQARQVNRALAASCDGAPTTTVRVTDVGLGRKVPSAIDGAGDATRLPVTLVVGAPGAEAITLATAEQGFETPPARFGAVSAEVRDGRATIRTWLDADCQMGYVPPPLAALRVTTAQGTFPVQVTVNDTALTESLAVNCPELPLQQLVEFGWADPRVP